MEYGHEKCKKALICDGFYVVCFNCQERIKYNRDRKRFIYNDNISEKTYLKNYSKEVHRTNRDDVFYCYYGKPDAVLSYYSDTKFIFYRKKKERLFMPKFYHDRNTVNFLKELQFIGEFDTIDKTGFSENPTTFGRKLYEYRIKTGATSNKFIETKGNGWRFPDTYFTSKGYSVRGFSFVFPNASAKFKEHLLPSKSLLNIT